jgi:hypothetical protein
MNDILQASKLYRADRRFRVIVDSIVARTMHEHGRVDPDRADAEAHDIARKVAALLLTAIYDGDGEIAQLRLERDHWQERALQFANLTAIPQLIVVPAARDQDQEEGQ